MNSVYTMRRPPATVTAAAGVLMLGYAAVMLLQAQQDAVERSSTTSRVPATLKAGHYAEGGESPTLGVNLFDFAPNDGAHMLSEASEAFSASLSDGMQSLGTEFATVIEDNFWDLVLR